MFDSSSSLFPRDPVKVLGSGGVRLSAGDVITDAAAQRLVVIDNGLCRVTFGIRTPDVQRGCHMLQLPIGGAWTDTMEADIPDWSYFGGSIVTWPDRTIVRVATDDAVELSLQWDAHNLNAYATGLPYRDHAEALNYAQGAVNPNWKVITDVFLEKNVRVERGAPGYFVGYRSLPYIGPPTTPAVATSDYGEREIGQGGRLAVAWSSNPARAAARWPAWADDVDGRWTAQGLGGVANKVWWAGIRDPLYAPYNGADWIACEGAGYPATQANGPYYCAGIHDTLPVCHVIAMREALPIGAWKVGTAGGFVCYNVNEARGAGPAYRHAVWIGGLIYYPRRDAAYANEPTAEITARAARAASGVVFPY